MSHGFATGETPTFDSPIVLPDDGSPNTIESISIDGTVLKQLANRSTYSKAKTDQLGYQIILFDNPIQSNPINQNVTATGSTPTPLNNSSFSTASNLAENDVIDFSFGPIDINNTNASGDAAYLLVQVRENSGSFSTKFNYKINLNYRSIYTVHQQYKCLTAGPFSIQLACLNNNSSLVQLFSIDQSLTNSCYTVMRPIV